MQEGGHVAGAAVFRAQHRALRFGRRLNRLSRGGRLGGALFARRAVAAVAVTIPVEGPVAIAITVAIARRTVAAIFTRTVVTRPVIARTLVALTIVALTIVSGAVVALTVVSLAVAALEAVLALALVLLAFALAAFLGLDDLRLGLGAALVFKIDVEAGGVGLAADDLLGRTRGLQGPDDPEVMFGVL